VLGSVIEPYVVERFIAGLGGMRAEGVVLADDLRTAEQQLERAQRELDAYISAVSAADVGPEAFAAGARERRQAVEEAQRAHDEAREKAGLADLPLAADLEADWPTLTLAEQNALLRAGLDAVVVERGRVPINQRTTIWWKGEAPEGVVRGRGSFMRSRRAAV
jgi:hypothetical protein